MKDLRVFTNDEFGAIRTVQMNDETYFVGKDVAEALGYERGAKAIQDHVSEEDKDVVPIQDSIGRMRCTGKQRLSTAPQIYGTANGGHSTRKPKNPMRKLFSVVK